MTTTQPTATTADGAEPSGPDLMAVLEGVFKGLPADYEREKRELPQKLLAERNALIKDVARLSAALEASTSHQKTVIGERDQARVDLAAAHRERDEARRLLTLDNDEAADLRELLDRQQKMHATALNALDALRAKVQHIEAKVRETAVAHFGKGAYGDMIEIASGLRRALNSTKGEGSPR